ncbi:MAG: peptidyl-prolyl cis-trans isomerase [Paludibacteraceae bacterium]|nr:peptidyl-prolyl cis-trans isomerase [Paludibacteraceae bacterium]
MKKTTYLILTMLLMCGCQYLHHKHQAGTAAEVNGQILLRQDLDFITRQAATPEDSVRIAEEYIRQWASNILLYDKASHGSDPQIEQLVDDYRRTLYIHAYEEELVKQKMDKTLPDSLIESYYEEHKDRFVLKESIVKGILLVVPKEVPQADKLRRWMQSTKEEDIEHIEKYAYQYATGYEFFRNEWQTANQLLIHLPLERNNLNELLANHNFIEVNDSTMTYFLQVSSKHSAGEQMPIEFARPYIEDVLLAERQATFLRKHLDALYNEGRRFGKVKIYNHDNID